MHPPEDLSLEEIRARKPKYLKKVTTAIANAISYASSNAQHQHQQQIQSSILQHQQQQQQNMLAAQSAAIASAQEVRIQNNNGYHWTRSLHLVFEAHCIYLFKLVFTFWVDNSIWIVVHALALWSFSLIWSLVAFSSISFGNSIISMYFKASLVRIQFGKFIFWLWQYICTCASCMVSRWGHASANDWLLFFFKQNSMKFYSAFDCCNAYTSWTCILHSSEFTISLHHSWILDSFFPLTPCLLWYNFTIQ